MQTRSWFYDGRRREGILIKAYLFRSYFPVFEAAAEHQIPGPGPYLEIS